MALEVLEQTLAIRREMADRRAEAITLNNLGMVHKNTGDLPRALDYLAQSLPIRREVHDHVGEAKTLNNMAKVYQLLGQLSRALECFRTALTAIRPVKDLPFEADILINTGDLLQELGRYEDASRCLVQAVELMVTNSLSHTASGMLFQEAEELLEQLQWGENPKSPARATIPLNFVMRCVAAFSGPPALKAQTFDELQRLSARQSDLAPLIRTVQNAFFGTPLADLGQDLADDQAEAWAQIVAQVNSFSQ
jgi:tetratricopeptide (TPR) repeat protein